MPTKRIVKAKNNTIANLNFGLTIMVRGKLTTMTGISPSPSYANVDALLKDLVAFLNKKLGTHYKIVS